VSVGRFRTPDAKDRFVRAYDAAMAELPAPDHTHDLQTGYGTVRAYGFDGANSDAAPFVLLPGRASASPVWADNLASLRALRTVWLFDLLGEPGMSVQHRPIEDGADQARWLADALAALPAERVHLLGLSIGGWAAMNLAIRDASSIMSVIVLDPVFTFANVSLAALLRAIPASLPWLPRRWRDGFASWTAGGAPVADVPVAAMIEAGIQTYRSVLPAPKRLPEDHLAALEVPVLAIIAGASPLHNATTAAVVARRTLPRGRVEVYAGASHAVNGEQPDRIAADVAAFLADVEHTGHDGVR
jgi:pimeloyl-ACP methyl ester carboxylesterase